jgi:DegV family protein with EDD domain
LRDSFLTFTPLVRMAIRYLDGRRLHRAVVAGSHWVRRMQESLNRINVFPVSDSDTGTNMTATLAGAASTVPGGEARDVSAASRRIADSTLLGARGNSGAILAQFFQGLAEGLEGCGRVTLSRFASAALRGADAARSALGRPQEGTILTVMSDWARQLEVAARRTADFADAFGEALGEARRSLARTPQQLRVLARAGVVDAGAQGFVHLLEGVQAFLETRRARWRELVAETAAASATEVQAHESSMLFQYCTECLLEGEGLDRGRLRDELGGLGDSLVIAGSGSRLRVHVHTNDPEAVFGVAARQGRVASRKADDMRAQHHRAWGLDGAKRPIAVVSDSACDLPDEVLQLHGIHIVPLRVQFGSESFLDGRTLTATEFYARLASSPFHPTTSQPAPADFVSLYGHLTRNHEHVLSIHLAGAVSGTLQAAERAARQVDAKRITVLDSHTACAAQGLVVLAAAEAVAEGLPLADVIERARRAASEARLFVGVPTLEFLVRGGRVSRGRGAVARLLGLQPILTLDAEGRPTVAGRVRGRRARLRRLLELTVAAAGRHDRPRFAVAHADAIEAARELEAGLRERFPGAEVLVQEVGPVLGTHGGPGATAVAVGGALAPASAPAEAA